MEVVWLNDNLVKIKRVLWIVLFLNLGVAAAKSIMGLLIRSTSMTADGVHSLADGSSNIVGLVGITAALKPVDRDHPYGHKKFETFASLGVVALLLLAVIGILHNAWSRLGRPVVPAVNGLSFLVMIFTLVVNLWVFRYENKQGRALHSDLLVSDAYHTLSDVYVSLAVIVTLLAVKFGMVWVDPAASLVIAGLIAHAAWEIIRHSSSVLCDKAVLDEERIVAIALEVGGVRGCHKVRSRGRADDLQVDLHIEVDPQIAVEKAHEISHQVAAAVSKSHEGVADVVVHIEPVKP
jgi:cation diffusion facilitator family transporter